MTWDEVEELACLMLNRDYDSMVDNHQESTIDDIFYETYHVTLEEFESILIDLVKFTPSWKSPITGEIYQGFVTKEGEEDGHRLMRAIIKEKV